MKAMAGQVWYVSDGSILILTDLISRILNRNLSRGIKSSSRPVFRWHNENSEGEWNNFGCGFTKIGAVRKVKPKKVEGE